MSPHDSRKIGTSFGTGRIVALVLSVLWLLNSVDAASRSPSPAITFMGLGVFPLAVLWGVWAVQRTRTRHLPKPRPGIVDSGGTVTAASSKRLSWPWTGVGLFLLAFAIAGVGAHIAGHDAAYGMGRSLRQFTPIALLIGIGLRIGDRQGRISLPLVLGMLFVAWTSFAAVKSHTEFSDLRRSAALAFPLIARIQNGDPVSESEVRSAQIGQLEPLVLAHHMFYVRETALVQDYQERLAAFEVEKMLDPSNFTPDKIRSARVRLADLKSAVDLLESQLASLEEDFVSLLGSLDSSDDFQREFLAGARVGIKDGRATRTEALAAERKGLAAISDLYRFLADAGDRYVIHDGQISFSAQADLDQYGMHLAAILAAAEAARSVQEGSAALQATRLKQMSEFASSRR